MAHSGPRHTLWRISTSGRVPAPSQRRDSTTGANRGRLWIDPSDGSLDWFRPSQAPIAATVGVFSFPPQEDNKPTEGKTPHPYEQRVGISGNCASRLGAPRVRWTRQPRRLLTCPRREKGRGKIRRRNSEEKSQEEGKSSQSFFTVWRRKGDQTENITKLRT